MAGTREGFHRELNGYKVSQAMYDAAQATKRRGGRVFITVPGALPVGYEDSGVCGNCGGVGTLYLEYITGGPYDRPPAHQSGTDNDGKRVGPSVHPSWFSDEGKWYAMTMNPFPCVVCQGAMQTAQFEQAMELALG